MNRRERMHRAGVLACGILMFGIDDCNVGRRCWTGTNCLEEENCLRIVGLLIYSVNFVDNTKVYTIDRTCWRSRSMWEWVSIGE